MNPNQRPIQKTFSNKGSSFLGNLSEKFPNSKSTLNLIVGLFLVIIFLLVFILIIAIKPFDLLSQLNVVQVVNEVASKASVPPAEVPVVAVVGDNKLLPEIDAIKKLNSLNAEVYKDAQNGDYVLAYSSKMVIYRRGEGKIVYDGDSPATKLNKIQTNLQDAVYKRALDAGIIQDGAEKPQIAIIADPETLESANPDFYKNAEKNDVVATFSKESLLVLYRPSNDSILKTGKVSTQITDIK